MNDPVRTRNIGTGMKAKLSAGIEPESVRKGDKDGADTDESAKPDVFILRGIWWISTARPRRPVQGLIRQPDLNRRITENSAVLTS